MASVNVKDEARRLVENLPEDATWDDLMYQIYVRQAIEAGFQDSEAGRTGMLLRFVRGLAYLGESALDGWGMTRLSKGMFNKSPQPPFAKGGEGGFRLSTTAAEHSPKQSTQG